MLKKISLFFCLSLFAVSIHAQKSDEPQILEDSTFLLDNDEGQETDFTSGFAKEVLSDTTINFSDFSIQRDSISSFKLKEEYGWVTNIDSFLLAQKMEDNKQSQIVIKQKSNQSFLGGLFNSGTLQVLMWILAAGLVTFIIYKLFLSEGVFGRRSIKKTVNIEADDDDAKLLNDYNALFKNAYAKGDWRFAMRFLFLKTLQKLNENEMIIYAVDKTNSAYVKELNIARKNDFAALALYYEYVWYGRATIDKEVFDSIENKFNSFLNKI